MSGSVPESLAYPVSEKVVKILDRIHKDFEMMNKVNEEMIKKMYEDSNGSILVRIWREVEDVIIPPKLARAGVVYMGTDLPAKGEKFEWEIWGEYSPDITGRKILKLKFNGIRHIFAVPEELISNEHIRKEVLEQLEKFVIVKELQRLCRWTPVGVVRFSMWPAYELEILKTVNDKETRTDIVRILLGLDFDRVVHLTEFDRMYVGDGRHMWVMRYEYHYDCGVRRYRVEAIFKVNKTLRIGEYLWLVRESGGLGRETEVVRAFIEQHSMSVVTSYTGKSYENRAVTVTPEMEKHINWILPKIKAFMTYLVHSRSGTPNILGRGIDVD